MEFRFRVYTEFQVKGVIYSSMESEASWYLMTQAGELWEYGPVSKPKKCTGYDKIVPLLFTGFQDRSGKDIFDGDILRFGAGVASVVWSNGAFWVESPGSMTREHLTPDEWSDSTIIGNVYENPELLGAM